MNDARISVGDVSVITDSIDTLFTQLHTRDNCSSRRFVHCASRKVNNSSCVVCRVRNKDMKIFAGISRKLFDNVDIKKKNLLFARKHILQTHLNVLVKYVRNHSHLEYSPVFFCFFVQMFI